MTNSFDILFEQYLTELMPADLGIGASAMAKKIVKKAKDAPMSGHWKAIKRLQNMEKAVLEIMHSVFPEKSPKTGKEFAYSSVIDNKAELKDEIFKAIQKVTQKKGYAEQFARDRITTATLEEVVFELANEVLKKHEPVTQKVMRQKINQKLVKKPTASEEENVVYRKAADFPSDDTALVKKFNKLPENDLTWNEVVKAIGQEAAEALKKQGAIIEIVGAEKEPDEEQEVPALDVMDGDDDEYIASNFDRFINPYIRDTRDSFSKYHGDY